MRVKVLHVCLSSSCVSTVLRVCQTFFMCVNVLHVRQEFFTWVKRQFYSCVPNVLHVCQSSPCVSRALQWSGSQLSSCCCATHCGSMVRVSVFMHVFICFGWIVLMRVFVKWSRAVFFMLCCARISVWKHGQGLSLLHVCSQEFLNVQKLCALCTQQYCKCLHDGA